MTKLMVNLVSDIDSELWRRQDPHVADSVQFIYSATPIAADVHVIFGIRSPLTIRNASQVVFIVTEPPEILEYDLSVLRAYDLVLAPDFDYLRLLPNFRRAHGLWPWHVGVDFSKRDVHVNLGRNDLIAFKPGSINRVSLITSGKSVTKMQRERQKLIAYLQRHLPELEVFGRDTLRVDDKADVLSQYAWHIALENASHSNYWTEKLSDALLARAMTFYAGAPYIEGAPEPEHVESIDMWDHEGSYRRISTRLDAGISAEDRRRAEVMAKWILEEANLHSAVRTAIAINLRHLVHTQRRDRVFAAHAQQRRTIASRGLKLVHNLGRATQRW